MTTSTLSCRLDAFSMVTLAYVMERLADNGLYSVLTYDECELLADATLDCIDHAFRMVVAHRFHWIVDNVDGAASSYLAQAEVGCLWAATMQVVGEYQAYYLALTANVG